MSTNALLVSPFLIPRDVLYFFFVFILWRKIVAFRYLHIFLQNFIAAVAVAASSTVWAEGGCVPAGRPNIGHRVELKDLER